MEGNIPLDYQSFEMNYTSLRIEHIKVKNALRQEGLVRILFNGKAYTYIRFFVYEIFFSG